jgi:prolyl oligopeptidase
MVGFGTVQARTVVTLALWAVLAISQSSCGAPSAPGAPPPTPTLPSPTAMTEPEAAKPALPYPDNMRGATTETLHGVAVSDPYRWLEKQDDPAVEAWVGAQDTLARQELHKLPERDAIAARLKELFYVDSLSAPQHRGQRYFFSRRHADKEKGIVYVREGKKGAERVLLDPNAWSDDGSVSLGTYATSWDGKHVGYTVKENNSDEATLYVLDVATGEKSKTDVIEGAKYAHPSWTPDSKGFYYTWLPTDPSIKTADRPGHAEVRFHRLGTDPKTDPVIRGKTGDPTKFLSAEVSRDGRWLLLTIWHGWAASEVFTMDLTKGAAATFEPLAVGGNAHYATEAHGGHFYVMTDEGAPKYRVFRVDPKKPERESWQEIVPERADATLDGFGILGGRLALSYLKNASSLLEVRELDGRVVGDVKLPGVGSVIGPVGRSDEAEAYFAYQSFDTPPHVFELDMKTMKTDLYSKIDVPVDTEPYTVEQVFYPSKDGTRVSMFLVHRKDLVRNGDNRVYLYGYGGFQSSQTPEFTASIFVWLERGGIFALPNLRGGGEYGEAWHKDGMLDKKQNVFDDFIAAAEYLIDEKYTRPERLVISGGSNGGLLVGAAMVQRPDLFGAVVCAVPLLDMVRYHLFGSGKTWISEYGSADDPSLFKALHAYSPYHHVRAGTDYPPLLLLSADSDDRVDPLHARKFAAAVQDASRGGPVLLRVERQAGHGGADLRKAEVEKGADRYAFALFHTAGP